MIPPNMASNLRAMQKAYCLTFHRPNERAMLVTMFRIPLSALAFPTALLAACSLDSGPPPPPAGSPMALMAQAAAAGITASAVAPHFGGKVTIAGPRVVEVLPRVDGLVLAEVRDATGQPMRDGRVVVDVAGTDGQPHTLELRYDNDLQVFQGTSAVPLPPTPARVNVTVRPVGEAPTMAAFASVPVATVPENGGQVVLVGPVAPEVRVDSDGQVHAYLPAGAPRLPSGSLYANVSVGQPTPQRVELVYDEPQGHYVAQLGPDARPVGGEFSLEFEAGGQPVDRGRVTQVTVAPPRRLGGVVVVAGDYGLEVAPVDNELHATIADRSGAYVAAPPPRIEVVVVGRQAPVVMRWDATRRVYVAPIPVGVDVETAPIRVEIHHGGRRHRGTVHMRGSHPGRGRGPARAVVVAPAGPRVDVRVEHPDPRPGVTVQINTPPPPRVDIRVGHPAPRAEVRVHSDNGRHRGHGKHRKHRKQRRR